MNETPDFAAATQIQRNVWAEGDFAMVAHLVVHPSELLAEALAVVPDERCLDVACGSGNLAIALARRAWGNTVGADFVPELLQRGRERAAAERLEVEFVEADAQALPFRDGEFDVVASIFGAMFAPDQERAAAELVRVVRPGGRIGMGNWTPDGRAGELFAVISEHAPPPPGAPSSLRWGTEQGLRELFGDRVSELRVERRLARQPFRSPDHYIEFFRTYFGPMKTAFARVGEEGAAALERDLLAYLGRANTAGDGACVLESEYLQVVATRA